jgi:MFS family permease
MALLVPLLPMIRGEFALDYTQSGLLISAFTLSNGISQVPAGWLADRIGHHRILITVSISGVALAGLLVGLSQTYLMMLAFLVLMGLAAGGYHPASAPLISKSVDRNYRGRALGFHMIGGSASYFLAPLIGVAIASAWGWRGSFIGLALPIFLFGIIFFLILGHQEMEDVKIQRGPERSTRVSVNDARPRHLIAFMALSTFTQAVIVSTIAFIPLFIVDHFGVSKETAATFVAIVYSAGFWAGPLGGYLSDRLGQIPVILALCFISGPVIYFLNLVPYGLGLAAMLLALGMTLIARSAVSQAFIICQTPEHYRSTILGIYFFSGQEGSGILTPAIGYLIDQFGFYVSLTVAAVAIICMTFTCSVLLLSGRGQSAGNIYTF